MLRALVVALAGCHVFSLNLKSKRESARAGVWAPPDLHAVSVILDGVLHTRMSPENRKLAQHVAEDVKADIAAVVNGKNMSKKAMRATVAMAIKEIEGLQHKLEEVPNVTALKLEIDTKTKEMQEKKKELEMEEKEIKVMMLKKELMEKKLKLQKLMEAKMSSKQSKQSQKEEAQAQNEVVAKLAVAAKGLASSNTTKLAAKGNSTVAKNQALSGIIADLKARQKKLSDIISKMDADEKKRTSNLEAMTKKELPAKKDDPLAKGQAMLKGLDKEEHRKYQKERAIKKAQLAEIDSAIKSIAKGDVAALEQTLKKMKAEVKALDAKTGNFIY